ncbi:MAG: LysR family transcriptional regulator [Nannocystaceae bacterium]
MLPDFNRLRVFFHVHQSRSVSAAAAALHVTQSAVSQSLAKLEDELGAQLFVRRHRAIAPTDAGDALFSVVAPFVAALHGGIEAIRRTRRELVGTLRIGAPAEFGAHRVPTALADFSRQHPGVAFTLRLGHPSELVPLLEEGRLDLALVDLFDASGRMAGFEVAPVMEESLVLVGAAEYEAAALQGSRAFTRLAAARFVDYHPSAPAARGWFRHHFERAPSRIDLTLAVESVQAVIRAVERGMGLGVVPAHSVAAALEEGRLTAIGTRRRPLTNRISLVRLLDREPSRLEQEFAGFVIAALRRGT